MRKIFFISFLLIGLGCISDNNDSPEVGDLAEDLLADEYDSIVIEIDYQAGSMPNVSSLTFFKEKVAAITNKTVLISLDDEISEDDIVENYSKVTNLCKPISQKYRDFYGNKTTLSIYIIFIENSYELNEYVMGIAYAYDSFVLFGNVFDIIQDIGGSYYTILAERYVMLHEFGHILGLSNWDGDGNAHCNNSSCVMHETFEVYRNYSYFIQNFMNGEPEFCDECYAELEKKR